MFLTPLFGSNMTPLLGADVPQIALVMPQFPPIVTPLLLRPVQRATILANHRAILAQSSPISGNSLAIAAAQIIAQLLLVGPAFGLGLIECRAILTD